MATLRGVLYEVSQRPINIMVVGIFKIKIIMKKITESEAIKRFKDGEQIWIEDEDETLNTDTDRWEKLKSQFSLEQGDTVEDITNRCAYFTEEK